MTSVRQRLWSPMKAAHASIALAAALLAPKRADAFIWDPDTLRMERLGHPTLARAIVDPKPPVVDTPRLEARVRSLHAAPRDGDASWCNELGGALLRLGRPGEALAVLEPAVARHPDDYGVHANLGTAYHLLGRYVDAEKEIRADLAISPDAHFGVEKYHLALLQYLLRNEGERSRHLFVDELSAPFMLSDGPHFQVGDLSFWSAPPTSARDDISRDDASVALWRRIAAEPAAYRATWNLHADPKLEAGIIYMAELNPNEPACTTMLGVASLMHEDLNLARVAFDRAADQGSPMGSELRAKSSRLRDHIQRSQQALVEQLLVAAVALLAVGGVLASVVTLLRRVVRKRAA